jgi:hypothetical protein
MSSRVKTASDHDAFLVIAIVTLLVILGLVAKFVLAG